ncbi:universal stress protein [Streptomyces sp.]|uniref:universal stress protein n=1 Tax=Streptomyces sp. TaxID=1931 RepID=UPI002D774777|nr:universal stress protein [Streptomyces sp.]HET6352675.1 universal stress protein [Streptomyces sp.]
MTALAERREMIVGVDPQHQSRPALAWAADEAHRRQLALRLLLAVPPSHDTRRADSTAHHIELRRRGAEALTSAASWIRERHGELELITDLLDGFPALALCRHSEQARMVVLGSRRLGRAEEFFSASSVVVPVSAQANCPVVVVGEPEHVTQQPPYLVVGVDGSQTSRAAVAQAFEEASLRRAGLRALWVWPPPVVSFTDEADAVQERRRLLSEATAGWSEKYPDVALTHEVVRGHPVEKLARASEHALAVVVGRRGRGGYSGMLLGSVVHGVLHRALCPVITVPAL